MRGSVTKESTLQAVAQRRAIRKAFHGRNLMSFGLRSGNETRANGIGIKQNGAGAAVSGITTDLCPGQAEVLA